MASDDREPYWFHAKRYGYGWGLPARREGWIVLIVWILAVSGASPFIAMRSFPLFLVFMLAMAGALIAICYAKGEPTHWRWGE